ncbi:phage major capsid protein [Arcobacter sp.]|uniref:phage major capsid protein n=1 Tax=unclassified Arcobacter TaxID=2593671 RepID=UPI003B0020EC
MSLIKLIAARAEKFEAMESLVKNNPTMDETVKAQYNQTKQEFDALSRDIDISKAKGDMDSFKEEGVLPAATARAIATPEYKKGFNAYITGAELGDFRATMTVGVDADGGYIVPETYQKTVLQKLITFSRTRSISTVYATESTKNIPVEGDAPAFTWIDEGNDYGVTDSKFGNKQIGAWKLGGIIKVSEELLQDNMIDFDAYMSGQIAIGIDKAEAPAFCSGDGTKKPYGYSTGLVATTETTTAAVNAITEDEISSIFYALGEAYRQRATWRFNSKTLKKIRAIENGNGQKVFKDEIKNGTLEGRPYIIDENMPDMGASAKFLVFGDFTFYHIADRGDMSIQRLNEKYADQGMVGFKVRVRVDAKRMIDEAFVVGQNAAA